MSNGVKPITIRKPLVLNKKIFFKKDFIPFKGNVRVVKSTFQKDVLYEAKSGDFLSGDLSEVTIVNYLHKVNNACRTVAKCKSQFGEVYEKTSDEISKLIGQNNYDNLFASLCSVINQELKIRGIYSILTIPRPTKPVACQSDYSSTLTNTQCQTDDTYINTFKKLKMKRRAKRAHLTPYVVRETSESKKPKRLIISPDNFEEILKTPDIIEEGSNKEESILPDLGVFFDDDSNNSIGKLSSLSVQTTPDILLNPLGMLVDKVTKKAPEIVQSDKEYVLPQSEKSVNIYVKNNVSVNTEDFHNVTPEQRTKMLLQQGLHDYQNCLKRDESGHLPIHIAVLNNDVDLLKRQCVVLKMRGISVDIAAENLTPLKMSLYQDNVQLTSLLLKHNADALATDMYDRNCFHIAAKLSSEHLQTLVNHYQSNSRKILEDDEALWKPEYSNKTDTELSIILFNHINRLFDSHGYTPLMLASKLGNYQNVKLLLDNSPDTVNIKMPSSGNTSLFLAVGSACMDSAERGNRSKVVDHFKRTIEILVECGADPNTPNFVGANVHDLIAEYNIAEISMLIANKLTYRNFSEGKILANAQNLNAFVIVKDEDGKVTTLEEMQKNLKSVPKLSKMTKKTVVQKTACKQNKIEVNSQIIIKSEISSDGKLITPDITKANIDDSMKKCSTKINAPKVQQITLNKPLIIKTILTPAKERNKINLIKKKFCKNNTND